MSSYTSISPDKLARLIGPAHTPVLIDVRLDEDFNADPRVIPSAIRRSHLDTQEWAQPLTGRSVIVVCEKGLNLSEGVAAWLRNSGVAAEILEGGFVGWQRAKLPTVPYAKLPARDGRGRTVWVTRRPAAVVGVILNLSIWFAIHTLFREVIPVHSFGLSIGMPVLSSVDIPALILAAAAAVAIVRFNIGMLYVLAGSCLAGCLLHVLGAIWTSACGTFRMMPCRV